MNSCEKRLRLLAIERDIQDALKALANHLPNFGEEYSKTVQAIELILLGLFEERERLSH